MNKGGRGHITQDQKKPPSRTLSLPVEAFALYARNLYESERERVGMK